MTARSDPMPKTGTPINYAVLFTGTTDTVLESARTQLGFLPGYTVAWGGPTSMVITRRYTPTWAIVVACVGIFFFLIGLLALLVKNTETLTLTAAPERDGVTRLHVYGTADQLLLARLRQLGGQPVG